MVPEKEEQREKSRQAAIKHNLPVLQQVRPSNWSHELSQDAWLPFLRIVFLFVRFLRRIGGAPGSFYPT